MRSSLVLSLLCLTSCVASELPDRVQALLDVAPMAVRGTVGIHVVDINTGKTLFALNEDQLMLPASNMKLFTVALALTRLGPGYRFETQLVRDRGGDLVLVGSGDPSMSGRWYPSDVADGAVPQKDGGSKDPLQAIEALAEQAVAAGLTRVDGDIVGDDSRYVWNPYPPSWTADDVVHSYGAPVSALTLNDNTQAIGVRPGVEAGQLARVTLYPAVEYFAIDNRVITVSGRATSPLRVTLVPGTRQLRLTGTIRVGAGASSYIFAVDDPALYAATALYNALLQRGVTVRGRPRAHHRTSGTDSAYVATSGEVLAHRLSPALAELLLILEKSSQNLHTEIMLREVGAAFRGEGTEAAGLREMNTLLAQTQVSLGDWFSEDGSGLARNDEVAPRAITRLLRSMYVSPYKEAWMSFLPVGGQDGTLSNRLCCMSDGSHGARIQAKTGTLARSIALSGYADNQAKGYLAFSILVNNYAESAENVRDWVDKVALALLE